MYCSFGRAKLTLNIFLKKCLFLHQHSAYFQLFLSILVQKKILAHAFNRNFGTHKMLPPFPYLVYLVAIYIPNVEVLFKIKVVNPSSQLSQNIISFLDSRQPLRLCNTKTRQKNVARINRKSKATKKKEIESDLQHAQCFLREIPCFSL